MTSQVFERVSLDIVEKGEIPFSLYFPKSRKSLAILCKAGSKLNERHMRLAEAAGGVVFIREADKDAFIRYAHDRLNIVLDDLRLSLDDKVRVVQLFISRCVRAIAAAGSSHKAFDDSRRAARYLVRLLLEEPEAAQQLFSLTSRESYLYSHPQNVAILNVLIGYRLFQGHQQKLEELALAGFWHDIGKVHVRKEIIYKQGSFTAEEREAAERHVFYSERVMRAHAMPEEVCLAGRHHHERWDGLGYPDGQAGRLIPFMARITAVSDTYDAITSDRVYKEAKPEWKALVEMARDITGLDPRVFDALLEVVLRNEMLVTEFREKLGLFPGNAADSSSQLEINAPTQTIDIGGMAG